ncbi:MAG: ROK family protein [Verrucomicrobiales bacterium]
MRHVVGIDIGGTRIKALLVDETGAVLAETIEPTGDDGTPGWKEHVRAAAAKAERMCGLKADAYGVAAPGIAARDGLSISLMPGRLRGLEGHTWQDCFGSALPVPVMNDAQAALLGEIWLGAGHHSGNAILLTLGTGVGGAVMLDGRLLHGHIGRAGHLGHVSLDPGGPLDIVGTPGSLEDAIGNHSVARRTGGRFADTNALVRAVEAGEPWAIEAWHTSVRALAAAIAGFINVLDPECVILGGGISQVGPTLFDPLRQHLEQFEWRPDGHHVQILPASLGERAGALGAARAALDSIQ